MVWIELISGARFWKSTYAEMFQTTKHNQMLEVLSRYRRLAETLHSFPAERWQQMAMGAGWNAVACTALSWCQGASLEPILAIWREFDEFPAQKPAADFAALIFNSSLLPENRLSSIVAAGKDCIGAALLLAARTETPIIDLSSKSISQLPQYLREMIEMRM